MSKHHSKQSKPVTPSASVKKTVVFDRKSWGWMLGACLVAAVAFYPILSNGFTNWDDQFYITENPLVIGSDWGGLLTQQVVSNYHPLTMVSLGVNYLISGQSPFSYHFFDLLLHLLNTALVFVFTYRLSKGNHWVGAVTALVFGIHPMHVESVAWASGRKDMLFTAFFLLSLIWYLKYLDQRNWKNYAVVLGMFALSLLSKPAAVTLPVVLLLLDWYTGRSLKDKKGWMEKLPFFALSLIFGVMTLQIQAEQAIADQSYYPLWQRIVFAWYGFGEYIKRLVWPFPLSAIHPLPNAGTIPPSYYPGLLLGLGAVVAAWFFRREKSLLFGLGFYAVNVALVLQLLSFGNAIVSERYTYVPYIGLVFGLMMLWANSSWSVRAKNMALGAVLVVAMAFTVVTNLQTRVWKNSETLWTNAIEAYPTSVIALSNRGFYLYSKLGKMDDGLADYNLALQTEPDHANSLENRTIIYLHKQNFDAALADADHFVKAHPQTPKAYLLRAFTLDRLQRTDEAIADYTKCLELNPAEEEARSNRGVIYYNVKKDYDAAKADFDAAIQLNPKKGVNYMNRARCWAHAGNKAEAKRDIEMASQLGEPVDEVMRKSVEMMK